MVILLAYQASSPESEAELVLAGGQAGGAGIRVGQVDSLTEPQHCYVMCQPPGVKARMLDHPGHCVLLVLHQLRPLEGAGVILPHSDLQASDTLQVMCRSDDL